MCSLRSSPMHPPTQAVALCSRRHAAVVVVTVPRSTWARGTRRSRTPRSRWRRPSCRPRATGPRCRRRTRAAAAAASGPVHVCTIARRARMGPLCPRRVRSAFALALSHPRARTSHARTLRERRLPRSSATCGARAHPTLPRGNICLHAIPIHPSIQLLYLSIQFRRDATDSTRLVARAAARPHLRRILQEFLHGRGGILRLLRRKQRRCPLQQLAARRGKFRDRQAFQLRLMPAVRVCVGRRPCCRSRSSNGSCIVSVSTGHALVRQSQRRGRFANNANESAVRTPVFMQCQFMDEQKTQKHPRRRFRGFRYFVKIFTTQLQLLNNIKH
jgi:hypothetical protein